MVGKKEYKIVGLVILLLLYCVGFSPLTCSSAEVWSDDFNDGDYDGWTICENSVVNSGSNWTATSNFLKLDQEDGGVISHPSDVTYGTWSFDLKANETQVRSQTMAAICFISNNLHDVNAFYDWTGYWIQFIGGADESFDLSLRKSTGGGPIVIVTSETRVPFANWHRIEVTRTTTGLFSVYHNGSLIMQEVDTDIDTSELFAFYPGQMCGFAMLDNVVVDDTPPATIDWLLIGVGVSTVVIILVLVIILKRR